jgi:lipoprotein-anchoring transpeptidase ErfK/SrfK
MSRVRKLVAAAARLPGWQRVAAVSLLAVLLVAGGAIGAAASTGGGTILHGVRVDGVPLGGMTREQAIAALNAHVTPILTRTVTVRAAGRTWTVSPALLGRQAAVEAAVDRALAGPSLSALARGWHRLSGKPVTLSVPLDYRGADQRAAVAFARRIAPQVAVAPGDAVFELDDGRVVKRHARAGHRLDLAASAGLLTAALRPGGPSAVTLPLTPIAPRTGDADLGYRIVIDKTSNTLDFYQGFRVLRHYDVATARTGFVTPSGTWRIAYKEVNPTWHNPAPDGWGKGEPLVIPPGPDNPLGTRAMALNASGIFIHGSPADGSIGSHASHGCIRMHIWQAEELYPLVPVGTPVLIHS